MRCDAMRCAPSPSTVRARLLNRPGSIHSRNRSPDPSSWARHDVPFRPVPSRSRASQWCAPCAGRPRRAVRHPPASRGPATRTSGPHRKWMQRGTVRCFLQARTTVRTRSHGVLYRYVLSTREEARRGEARRGEAHQEASGTVRYHQVHAVLATVPLQEQHGDAHHAPFVRRWPSDVQDTSLLYATKYGTLHSNCNAVPTVPI